MTSRTGRHTYDYRVDLDNPNTAAANVVSMVGTEKYVLEIGSGPGSITRQLKERSGCRVVAIEVDFEAAAAVAPFCERVYSCDLNDPSWVDSIVQSGRFDVVVAADVLEHLIDPWTTLRKMTTVLTDAGHIVVSLPHAGNNAVLACLLDGNFAYGKYGLLDRTHIRFFGLRNIEDLFLQAELEVVEAKFVYRHPAMTELADHWHRLPIQLQKALEQNPYGAVYQVVVKARPSPLAVQGLRLTQMAVPAARLGFWGRVIAAGRHMLVRRLGPEARDSLRRIVKHLGIRI